MRKRLRDTLRTRAMMLVQLLAFALALVASATTVGAEDEMMRRHENRGGIGTGNAVEIGIGLGGLIQQNARPTTEDPDKKKVKRTRKDNAHDKKLTKDKELSKAKLIFVGKPEEVTHDPKHRVGKLGDLNDHKQVVIEKDGQHFKRHYYYTRGDEPLTWYWYDVPIPDKDPVISLLKGVPVCDSDSDDCDDQPPTPIYIEDSTKPKEKPKKTDKKEVVAKKEDPIDCLVVIQYPKDTSEEDQKAGKGSNANLMGSAKALVGKDTVLKEVNSDSAQLPKTISEFAKNGKCCRSLEIVSHGGDNGSLILPYEMPDPDEVLTPKDKREGRGRQLGGPGWNQQPGSSEFNKFVTAIKEAFCKADTPKVTFDACQSGKDNGIASQVSERGIIGVGHDGVCEVGPMVDEKTGEKTYQGPGVRSGSALREFKPDEPVKELPRKP
jgi:hypothetical protein